MHVHMGYASIEMHMHAKVRRSPSNAIDRLAVELNEDLLTDMILHLGTRVSVDTLEVHVKALYDLMRVGISSLLPTICIKGGGRERVRVFRDRVRQSVGKTYT